MERRSHQTGTPLSQNGTSLLLPLNETVFSDFGTPATLFWNGDLCQWNGSFFIMERDSPSAEQRSPKAEQQSLKTERLSLWNGLASPFFSWSQRRPQPCYQRQPKSVRVRSKGLQTMGLQAFFSIWRDYVERFKYPKRSVERPCSRHLS